eukprot:7775304-Ditylum_brightwellii.AAC.1
MEPFVSVIMDLSRKRKSFVPIYEETEKSTLCSSMAKRMRRQRTLQVGDSNMITPFAQGAEVYVY